MTNNLNFPNLLTLIRVSLIPILVIIYYLPIPFNHELSAGIFVLASITDWLDGYLARKLKQETKFGAFCDPIADKLIVIIAIMLLLESYCSYLITIPAIFIVSREILISALREWMAQQRQEGLVAVMYLGKVKTALQMTAIAILLYANPGSHILSNVIIMQVGKVLLVFAAVITVWTMLLYLKNAYSSMFN